MILIYSWVLSFLLSFSGWIQPVQKPIESSFVKPVSEIQDADALYRSAKALIKREMYKEAVPYFSKAASQYQLKRQFEQSARSHLYNAEIYQYFGDNKAALKYLDSSKAIASRISDANSLIVAEILRTKGRINRNLGKVPEAKENLEASLKIAILNKGEYDTSLSFTYNSLGLVYDQLFNYNKSVECFQKALKCKLLSTSKLDFELADYYYNIGNENIILGNYQIALTQINFAISLSKIIDARLPGPVLDYYLSKAIILQLQGQYDASFSTLELAEQVGKTIVDRDLSVEGLLYIVKGNLFLKTGDFQRGKETVQYACYLVEKDPLISGFKKYWINYYLSDLFYRNGDYKLSLQYAYKSLKIQKDYFLADYTKSNFLIASNLYKLGDIENANKYYSICIDNVKKARTQTVTYRDRVYTGYGHFLYKTGKKEAGIAYAKEGMELNKASFGLRHPVTADNLNQLGELYALNNSPKEAMDCFQQALIATTTSFTGTDCNSNPDLDNIVFKPEAFLTLKNKAAALSKFALATNDINQLKASFNTYQLSLDLVHKNRASFPELESKIWISGEEKATFDGAINTAYELYTKTGAEFYKQKVFEFSEQSKAAALFASLREKNAMQSGGIPDSLLKKENYFINKIESLQNGILAEEQNTHPSKGRINDLKAEIFVLRNEQSRLISSLEKNFPAYHHLKYDKAIVSVEQLRQRLNDQQVLIEYAFTGNDILIFAITPERYEIFKVEKPADFDALLVGLRAYLDEMSFISQTNEVYDNFLTSAHDLYELLIKPADQLIKDRNIIIVPDEYLATIPFEVLLTDKVNSETQYGYLPYLIVRNPIGYAYSGNLLYYQPSRKPQNESLSMAAFSPSYEDLNDEKPGSANFRYRGMLKPLPFARKEANTVSRIFGGDVYSNDNACESNFKKVAPRYDVLHLSMHAIVDNENPMYSNLAFGKDKNGEEDGYLNTFELLNMKLNARMAVLSACNTGVGALQRGEGIMSLARGFYYAGCPDVVMTLWPVEDQLSSSLIQDFYHYLSLGKNKAEALQLAKINFLKSVDPLRAHPYFWAGYVNIGDTSPLVEKQQKERPGAAIAWASILGLLLTLLPFAWKLF